MKVSLLSESGKGRTGRRQPAERAGLLRLFRKSGLTQREFARTHGFSVATLQNWMRREQRGAGRVSFQEIEIDPETVGPLPVWDAEVSLRSGVILRVRGDLARAVAGRLVGRS